MHGKKFAVFDIDGTLIRWQLYHAVVDKLAASGVLGPDAQKRLHDARMVWKRREHSESFKEYETVLIEIYESALTDIPTKNFDEMVQAVIAEYKDQTYTYTRKLLQNLKKQRYILLAISGSHQELVHEIAKYYGFDDFVGTRYSRKGDTFGRLEFIGSADKKTALEQLITKHDLSLAGSIAVGDSASDGSMLKLVEQPIAFNPDQALLKIAQKNNWKVVVERKNVVYELESKNGTYVLA